MHIVTLMYVTCIYRYHQSRWIQYKQIQTKYIQRKRLEKKLVHRLRVYVFVCICMYWCCIFDLFFMYFVCIVCISQNVSVSMRLATFAAENTSKYIQYRQIQISYIVLHTPILPKYIQNKSVTMCMYVHVFACICMYNVCMSVFYASKDMI